MSEEDNFSVESAGAALSIAGMSRGIYQAMNFLSISFVFRSMNFLVFVPTDRKN